MERLRHVLLIALATGILTLLMDLIAGIILVSTTLERGLAFRTGLVFTSMLVVAMVASRRSRDRHLDDGLAVLDFAGMCLGWVVNPFSWPGRSYVGQWWSDVTAMTIVGDIIGWILSAAVALLLARILLLRAAVR